MKSLLVGTVLVARVAAFRGAAALRTPLFRARCLSSLPEHLQEAKDMIARDEAMLLDVREADEWQAGHFASARLVPFTTQLAQGDIPADIRETSKTIYIHCKAGGRAVKSAEVLKQAGLEVVPFAEGFAALRDLGFDDVQQ